MPISVCATSNAFAYNVCTILVIYAAAAVTRIATITVSVRALAANSISMTTSFTVLLTMTYNASLARLIAERYLGAELMLADM
jgi:hypothetical protein